MATQNISQIPAPRVPLVDVQMNTVSREWFMWFNNLYAITGTGTGITPVINGGTGLGIIPTNGQLLIGNGTGYSLRTLTAGNGISVTNGSGTIFIANTGVLSFSGGATGLPPATATTGAVTLAGTLAIASGGTNGFATPTAYGVAYGTGAAYAFTSAGTTGQVLTATTGSAPTWATPTTSGTVTSVAALTLGTTGTDLSSTVANSTTTPVITLNVPTASATNRGALSAADWTTFNGKGTGTVTSVATAGTVNGLTLTGGPITASGTVTLGGTLDLSSPPAIGSTAASTGAFTTLSASSTVSGTGFSTYLASPPAIGGTAAAAGTFTTLTGTTSTTTPIVQNSAAAAIAFKTNSATSAITQFNINHTASAVNYVQVTGAATATAVALSFQGSDGNISGSFISKGSGTLRFLTNTTIEQLRVLHTGSAVNYLTATGNIAGASPALSVAGTDTDIDLTLTPKGAGNVRFGTYTASALLAVAGYITIKDSGGTTRRLLVG